jgi:hypothetical protein
VGLETQLSVDRGADGVIGGVEGHEEAVAVGPDLVAAPALECGPQDPVVLREHLFVTGPSSSCSSLVEPWISENSNVTVPEGIDRAPRAPPAEGSVTEPSVRANLRPPPVVHVTRRSTTRSGPSKEGDQLAAYVAGVYADHAVRVLSIPTLWDSVITSSRQQMSRARTAERVRLERDPPHSGTQCEDRSSVEADRGWGLRGQMGGGERT